MNKLRESQPTKFSENSKKEIIIYNRVTKFVSIFDHRYYFAQKEKRNGQKFSP